MLKITRIELRLLVDANAPHSSHWQISYFIVNLVGECLVATSGRPR